MAPKCKSSDAGGASKPKKSRDVLSICGKVKILDMIELWGKKNCMRRLPGCMARTNLPFVSDEEQRKKFVLVFLLHRKLQMLMLQGVIKC